MTTQTGPGPGQQSTKPALRSTPRSHDSVIHPFTIDFLYSFNKHSLSTYYVQGFQLEREEDRIPSIHRNYLAVPCPQSIYDLTEESSRHKKNDNIRMYIKCQMSGTARRALRVLRGSDLQSQGTSYEGRVRAELWNASIAFPLGSRTYMLPLVQGNPSYPRSVLARAGLLVAGPGVCNSVPTTAGGQDGGEKEQIRFSLAVG